MICASAQPTPDPAKDRRWRSMKARVAAGAGLGTRGRAPRSRAKPPGKPDPRSSSPMTTSHVLTRPSSRKRTRRVSVARRWCTQALVSTRITVSRPNAWGHGREGQFHRLERAVHAPRPQACDRPAAALLPPGPPGRARAPCRRVGPSAHRLAVGRSSRERARSSSSPPSLAPGSRAARSRSASEQSACHAQVSENVRSHAAEGWPGQIAGCPGTVCDLEMTAYASARVTASRTCTGRRSCKSGRSGRRGTG